jgi:ribose transport system permease protein
MKKKTLKQIIGNILKTLALPLAVFIILVIATGGRFANFRIITTILRQSIVPAIIAWGLMLTFAVGSMNFSAGALVLCSTIIGGNLMKLTGTGLFGLILLTLVVALLLSVLMGFLFNKMRIPSIVLTIGLVLVFEALPRVFFEGGVVIPTKVTYLATPPHIFIILILMLAVFYIICNKLPFGHNLRSLGNNQEIANKVGLNSDKVKFTCFVISGAFLGVAAILYGSTKSEVRNVAALGSMSIMMDAFMGVFLATFLARFCDLSIAVLISSFTMKMISNGFVAMGLSATVRDITTGLLLFVLLAVSANQGLFEKIKENKRIASEADKKYRQKLAANQ